MKTINELVGELKQRGVLILEEHQKHTLPDLTFTLDCMCLPHTKREVETTTRGRVVKIRLTNIH